MAQDPNGSSGGEFQLPIIVVEGPPDEDNSGVFSYQSMKPADICCICLTETNILHLVKVPPNAVTQGIKPFLSSCGIFIEKEEVIGNEQLFHLSPVGVKHWFESSGLTLKILLQLFVSMSKIGWDLIPQEEVDIHETLGETSGELNEEMSVLTDKLIEQEYVSLYFINHSEPDLPDPSKAKFFGIILPHSEDFETGTNSLILHMLDVMKSSGMEIYYDMEFVVSEIPTEEFKNFGILILKYNPV